MDWRYGSGSRVPALQTSSLEFKPHQKKKVLRMNTKFGKDY
jgi:hypothetical protein